MTTLSSERLLSWWWQPAPLARIAVLRAALYLFLLFDTTKLTNDVIPHGYAPEFYQPTMFARWVSLPAPTPELARTLFAIIVIGGVIAAVGFLPRIAGWTVAAAYWAWLMYSMGFGYVDHDHLALAIAMAVLPTVGRARFTDYRRSEAAGWALRCIQLATIATYFFSAFAKWSRNGTPWAWANSSVFVWALVRRGTALGRELVDFPWVLTIGQWFLLLAEFLSPVVLFLRGKALAASILVFVGFHLMTYLALGIHFLPTVVCWLAFCPLERIPQAIQRRRGVAAPA